MKNLLVGILALTTATAAFADGHSMIKLDGCLDDGRCSNLDFNMGGDDTEDAEAANQTIALNYARAFAGNYGAGITYVQASETADGDISDANQSDNFNTIGLSFYWNKDGSWSKSCFAALHHMTTTYSESDQTDTTGNDVMTDISLEYGHRYALGSAMMGVTMNWVPSVSYHMTKTSKQDEDADDINSTELRLNVANFAATF